MKNFLLGVSTSSLQIEGTNNKFETIWDIPERNILDNSNCTHACKFIENYKDDVKLIKNLGVDVYRMSLSWARVWPSEEGFSKEGIEFYHQLFKELKKNNILVDVTLYHWDMPKWLYDKGVAFHTEDILEYFLIYSKRMFEEYDQYVNQWATFNEPWCVSRVGYIYGTHAPFITNNYQFALQADYYMLLCHNDVYDFYKGNYKKNIGIVLNVWGNHPFTSSVEDNNAAKSAHQFYEGTYLNPLFIGGFDKSAIDMFQGIGVDTNFYDQHRLMKVKDKVDFLGINYYMHNTVIYDPKEPFFFKVIQTTYPHTDMDWEINPDGLRFILTQIRDQYTDIPIYITENGSAFKDKLVDGKINDVDRIKYFESHFNVINDIKDTLNIKGYYLWSLMDNWEWHFGYQKRFGIIYIDYNNYKRIPKQSYYEYQRLIKERGNL